MYKKGFFSIALSVAIILIVGLDKEKNTQAKEEQEQQQQQPKKDQIKQEVFGYQTYEEIVETLKSWEKTSPETLEVEKFGKGLKNHYLRICNEKSPSDNVVLLTACIHGNEPLATSVMMSFVCKLISEKDFFDDRTIYFIPVLSIETYPKSRYVNGTDPNRDFHKNKSIELVEDIKELFLKIKPDAVLSGHTYGRVFLYPWGHTTEKSPKHEEYSSLAKDMSKLSGYGNKRICELYGHPIKGTESDWYDSNGAFSMVIEFGTHQRKPTKSESEVELNKTYKAMMLFIREAVKLPTKNLS
jgi:succinylglutamate desuccinylase